MPIAMEHKDQPAFRQHTYISAYGEGWALYCEKLGQGDGHVRHALTTASACSATRSGARHAWSWIPASTPQGWTREQAIDYFRQYTALPEREIGTEIDRYITWPGQALSYYLGERAILEGRAHAEKALGERFNIRAFHDAVLELGSVPLPVLKERIERFIAEGGRGPYPEME